MTDRFVVPERCIVCDGNGWVADASMRVRCVCTPSERREPPTLASLAGKYPNLTLAKDDSLTPAERDFLRALSENLAGWCGGPVGDAARRVVEEGR